MNRSRDESTEEGAEAEPVRALVYALGVAGIFFGTLYVGGQALGTWEGPKKPASRLAPGEVPRHWNIHEAAGFRIALPKSWKLLGPKEDWDRAKFRRLNPEFVKYLGESARRRHPNSKLHAFDVGRRARRIARRELFVTNMGVMKTPVSVRRLKLWSRDLRALESLPNRVGSVRRRAVWIGGHGAMRFRTLVRMRSPNGRRFVLSLTQWSVVAGRYEYVLSFTTTRSGDAAYAAMFDKSAKTFALPGVALRDTARGRFIREANLICASHFPPSSIEKLGPVQQLHVLTGVVAAQIRAMRLLSPPEESARSYERMLDNADRLLVGMKRYTAALARNNPGAARRAKRVSDRAGTKASRLARALGLRDCE